MSTEVQYVSTGRYKDGNVKTLDVNERCLEVTKTEQPSGLRIPKQFHSKFEWKLWLRDVLAVYQGRQTQAASYRTFQVWSFFPCLYINLRVKLKFLCPFCDKKTSSEVNLDCSVHKTICNICRLILSVFEIPDIFLSLYWSQWTVQVTLHSILHTISVLFEIRSKTIKLQNSNLQEK